MDSIPIINILLFILGGALFYGACSFILYRAAGRRWLDGWIEKRLLRERTEVNRKLEEMADILEKTSEREILFPGKESETLVEIWKRLQEALRAAHGYANFRTTRSLLHFDPKKKSNGTEKKLTERHGAMVDAYSDFREYFICSSNFLSTEAYLQLQGFVFDLGMYITRLADSSDGDFAIIRRDLDEQEASREALICGYIRSRIGCLIE